jgi:polysaccharide deacetylase family protein (PEP-CTERM system associated)
MDKKQNNTTSTHLLSFDVEEYFQVEAAAGVNDPGQWDSIPKRLPPAVDKILQLLSEYQTKATFFILGWVAQRDRRLVQQIAEQGHEVASHGMSHRMLNCMTPDEFKQELIESRDVLEDISQKPVLGFRAPTFSLTRRTAWAIDVLTDTGYAYDSSIFPIRHDRYGIPDAPTVPHTAVGPNGGQILEIPPLTLSVGRMNLPAAGGGYLRLLPVRLLGLALKKAQRRKQLGMIYLHPWELDPEQPVLPLSWLANWRHRVGLKRAEAKLTWLLKNYPFTNVAQKFDDLKNNLHTTYTYS